MGVPVPEARAVKIRRTCPGFWWSAGKHACHTWSWEVVEDGQVLAAGQWCGNRFEALREADRAITALESFPSVQSKLARPLLA